jgi:DNA-binding transcriptional LysR family regulator
LVVNHARRLLSINDLILHVAEPTPGAETIRIGLPEDFLGGSLSRPMAEYRKQQPSLRFSVRNGGLEPLLGELRQGQLDIVVGLSSTESILDARHHWSEQTVWLRGRSTRLSASAPVPLVSFSDDCIYHRTAVGALGRSGRNSELIFTGPSIASLTAAVAAGLGIMALPRSRARSTDLKIWDDAPLPKLPDLAWEVYLREGAKRGPAEHLVDLVAAALRTSTTEAVKSTDVPAQG